MLYLRGSLVEIDLYASKYTIVFMHSFDKDLSSEQILARYLDKVYEEKGYPIKRVYDYKSQLHGIDLIYKKGQLVYRIDEKAQLHYLNKDLPTFTFELSYFNKDEKLSEGWLFDTNKKTDLYFLITGIMLKKGCDSLRYPDDIKSLKITVVDRKLLIKYLNGRGLDKEFLYRMDNDLRKKGIYGKHTISGLNSKREGMLFFTEHLQEKPLNLQLRLSFLLESKVAKQIY